MLAGSWNYSAPSGASIGSSGSSDAVGVVLFIVALVVLTGGALLTLLLMVELCFKCACVLPNEPPDPCEDSEVLCRISICKTVLIHLVMMMMIAEARL
jgi:hypothetical protein